MACCCAEESPREGGAAVVGEVSLANDYTTDNYFFPAA